MPFGVNIPLCDCGQEQQTKAHILQRCPTGAKEEECATKVDFRLNKEGQPEVDGITGVAV